MSEISRAARQLRQSVFTALLLFILARVFDTGAVLAEDAEGTV